MATVLITGASRGIGRELADQYAADGWEAIQTCRDPAGAGLLCDKAGRDGPGGRVRFGHAPEGSANRCFDQ